MTTESPKDERPLPFPSWTVGLLVLTIVFLALSIVPFPQTAPVVGGVIASLIGLVALILNFLGRGK